MTQFSSGSLKYINGIYRVRGDQLDIDQLDMSDVKVVHDVADLAAHGAAPGFHEGRVQVRETVISTGVGAAETSVSSLLPYSGLAGSPNIWAAPPAFAEGMRAWLVGVYGTISASIGWISSQFVIQRPVGYQASGTTLPEVIARGTAQTGDGSQAVNITLVAPRLARPLYIPKGSILRSELVTNITLLTGEFVYDLLYLPTGVDPR